MPKVVHFEIAADNPDALGEFYSTVFGWDVKKWDGEQDYWLVDTGEGYGIHGGITRKYEGLPVIRNTVDVDSVEDYLDKITQAGGTIAMPKIPIQGIGWLAYAVDPEGNFFGIMKEDKEAA